MLSAHDVARELRARQPSVGALKVHKLAYYCQGWHLARTGRPMFEEAIEAWARGPVVADLWHDENKARPTREGSTPTDEELATIEYVLDRYGRHSGTELIRMTHAEDPWREVSESDTPFVAANPPIEHAALLSWFRSDDEYREHVAEAEELSRRRDVYGLREGSLPEDLSSATLRALEARSSS